MTGKYRTTSPMLGLISEASGHEAITVPAGSLLDLNGKTFNGNRLMETLFEGRMVMMFTSDLRAQTVPA